MTSFLLDKLYDFNDEKTNINEINHFNYYSGINKVKELTNKAIVKSNKRIVDIKQRIENDITKNNYGKYYQIKSLHEYKILNDVVNEKNIKHELHHTNKIKNQILCMNKVDKITNNSVMYGECEFDLVKKDYPILEFYSHKIPTLYCFFQKKIK
jgi:hypothetical protein